MSRQIIKGDELQLFLNNGAPKFATSHTLTLTGNTLDTNTKDHGFWGASEVGKLTWELTAECLYTDGDYDTMFQMMIAHTPINLKFAKVSNYSVNGLTSVGGDTAAWVADATESRSGNAYVTSLTANANTGENATYSITFTGAGPLKKDTPPSPPAPAFTFNKTFGWQTATQHGITNLTAFFQLDVSALPDDANLQSLTWYKNLSVISAGENYYTVNEWPENKWMISLETNIGSAATFTDTIGLVWTDANNETYRATPLNESDEVKWGTPTPDPINDSRE